MQVYREIPIITNQERERSAELVGITSVENDWTMARHRLVADESIYRTKGPFVLDSGTGMYLNAILLDIDIAPRVPSGIRKEAEKVSVDSVNPRRTTREKELQISGWPSRNSIWSGDLRFDTTIIYLRPERQALDYAIDIRSGKTICSGLEEARELKRLASMGIIPNSSVSSSIGVRELTDVLSGDLTKTEAKVRIAARTRRLARRQIRWFDKLIRTLSGRAEIHVVRNPEEVPPLSTMSDILGS